MFAMTVSDHQSVITSDKRKRCNLFAYLKAKWERDFESHPPLSTKSKESTIYNLLNHSVHYPDQQFHAKNAWFRTFRNLVTLISE